MKNIKKTVESVLSVLFPFDGRSTRVSVFMQDKWLARISSDIYVKDYMWIKR